MTVQINLLSNDEIGLALDKVLTFLSERGVRIQHKRLLKTLGQAGARGGSETEMVCFSRNFVEIFVRAAPERVLEMAEYGIHWAKRGDRWSEQDPR